MIVDDNRGSMRRRNFFVSRQNLPTYAIFVTYSSIRVVPIKKERRKIRETIIREWFTTVRTRVWNFSFRNSITTASIVSLRDAISRVSKRYARVHASLVARRFFPPLVAVPSPADPCARTRHAPSPRGINYTRLKPVSWRNSWLKLKLSLSLVFSPFLAVDVGKNKRFLREQPGISSCRQVLESRSGLTSSPSGQHSIFASIEPAL